MKLLIVEDESSLRELLVTCTSQRAICRGNGQYIRRGFGQIGSLFV